MPDGVYELANEVFLHIAAVQRRVADGDAPAAETIRGQTASLLRELDERAAHAGQASAWDQARAGLVYTLDELLGERWEWPGRAEWSAQRIERTLLDKSDPPGATRFYDLCDRALTELDAPEPRGRDARDLAMVLYTCLRLGFQGRLAADPAARRDYESRLFARLPAAAHARGAAFFPEASGQTVQMDPDYRPTTRLAYLVLGFVFLLATYLAASWGYWNDMVKDLRQTAGAVQVTVSE